MSAPEVATANTSRPGTVQLNATPSSGNPACPIDDPVNGTKIMHLGGEGANPTAVAQAGAGTGATASVDTNATDYCGKLSLTAGSAAWASGAQVKVTFRVPYKTAPYVQLEPANNNAANNAVAKGVFVTTTATDFTVNFATAEAAANAYQWFYTVSGT